MKGRRRVHFPETGYVLCTIYNRYALEIGESFRGPAVIEEREFNHCASGPMPR